MRGRRWLLAIGVLLVLIAVTLTAWRMSGGPRINRASYDQIEPGMNQAEVEAIIGVPMGSYDSPGPYTVTEFQFEAGRRATTVFIPHWAGPTHMIRVYFDTTDNRVVGKELAEPVQRPWWRQVAQWVGIE